MRLVLYSEFPHNHLNYMYIVDFPPPKKAGFITRPLPRRGYYIHVVECPLSFIPVMFMADHSWQYFALSGVTSITQYYER